MTAYNNTHYMLNNKHMLIRIVNLIWPLYKKNKKKKKTYLKKNNQINKHTIIIDHIRLVYSTNQLKKQTYNINKKDEYKQHSLESSVLRITLLTQQRQQPDNQIHHCWRNRDQSSNKPNQFQLSTIRYKKKTYKKRNAQHANRPIKLEIT